MLGKEPGYGRVAGRIKGAVLNAVNLSEIVAKLLERGASLASAAEIMEDLGLEIIPCDKDLAYRAAGFRTGTRSQGLSLGDRICQATAQRLGLPALTTDRTWADLKIGVRIDLVR